MHAKLPTFRAAKLKGFTVDIFCRNAHGIRWMIGEQFSSKFSQLILMKIIRIVATRRQDFMVKMHQINIRLELHRRPCWASLQRSLRPPSWI